MTLTYGSLFSGYGGLDLAVEHLTGASQAWHSEIEPAAIAVHEAHWPGVENLGDVTTVDWSTVPPVDVLCGGYPCQPFSTAGKRQGTNDDRHLWPHVADAVRVLRPRLVLLENVAGHLSLGFDTVLGDLADLGYDARWTCLPASAVGAPHRRQRLWIVATDANDGRWDGWRQGDGAGSVGGREGWLGWPAGAGADVAADTSNVGHERGRSARDGWPGSADHGGAPADADDAGRYREQGSQARRHQVPRLVGLDPHERSDGSERRSPVAWGPYAAAIARWEHLTGRPAPNPTDDRGRLNPELPEWMMGLPAGWVTGRVTRAQALRMVGNGVCPQQAVAAYRVLLGAGDLRAAAAVLSRHMAEVPE